MADMNIKLKLEDSNYQSKSKSDKTINNFLPKTTASISKTVGILGAIVGSLALLKNSSQHLKGTFEIFKRAFQLVLKPIGDFVSMLLRPLAILLLKWVRGILGVKSKESIEKKKQEGLEKLGEGDITGLSDVWDGVIEDITSKIDGDDFVSKFLRFLTEFALKLPSLALKGLASLGLTLWDIGLKIGDILYDNIIRPSFDAFKSVSDSIYGFTFGLVDGFNKKVGDILISLGLWISDYVITPLINLFKVILEKLQEPYNKVKTWIEENIVSPVSNFFNSIFKGVNDAIKHISGWIDDNIINPVKSFFNTLKSAIQRWINRLLSLMGDSGSSKGDKKSVNDAIITPKGDIITTNPKDYLIATKNPSDLLSNNKGINNLNININIEKIDSEMRIRELAEKISIEIARSNSYGV